MRLPCLIIRDSPAVWCEIRKLGFHFLTYVDLSHQPFGLMAHEIDLQQSVRQVSGADFDAVGKHKSALKLARCYAAVQILPIGIVSLLPANGQLIVFQDNLELIARETSNGQGDAEAFARPILLRDALNVVGGIAVGRGFRHPFGQDASS